MSNLLSDVIARLQSARGHWPHISQQSGVPYWTIAKIVQGASKNPRINTIERLRRYFEETDKAA
jgi:predicted transcriptional regulator